MIHAVKVKVSYSFRMQNEIGTVRAELLCLQEVAVLALAASSRQTPPQMT